MNNTPFSQRDPNIERRRALAKVYLLLLKLAEEAERKRSNADAAVAVNKKAEAPVSPGVVSPIQ
jgi:hypothetical protein